MRTIQIRARTDEEVECLVRELAVYAPKWFRRSILLECDDSQTKLLAMLTAIETCLSASEIESVRIEIDGKKYLMAPHLLDRR
jgi:hypothetical protein